ncbi:MAG: hypothetical protein WC776_04925 [Patescibacteria group bacterium]|jgi:hypothetical protein
MADLATIKRIIVRIEKGESERSACESEKMARTTFRSMMPRELAADHYAKALASLAEAQVTQLEATIQDMRDGTLDHQIGRIEVDARKWLASKFLPKRYGEKIDHTTGGEKMEVGILMYPTKKDGE